MSPDQNPKTERESTKRKLVAVLLGDDSLLCPGCAWGRFAHLPKLPASLTEAFEGEDWRDEVSGTCADCGDEIQERALPVR